MNRTIALVLGAALGAVTVGSQVFGDVSPDEAHAGPALPKDGDIADVAEKVLPSVVTVATTQVVNARSSSTGDPFFDEFFGGSGPREGHGLGSGVIVSAKGYVLTNNHVVANATDIKVSLSDGRDLEATLVGADPKADLAVLKLKGKVGKVVPAALGESGKMRLGDVVLAIGNPLGVGQSVTMGIISAKGRANMGLAEYEDYIQTDAAINQGNSGGALINMRGEVIGINTAISASRNGGNLGIGFAIPMDMARPIMDSLISRGKVVRGYLGVTLQDVTRDLAEPLKLGTDRGVLVTGVVASSPAAKAGLKRNDVVLKIDGRVTEDVAHLRNLVAGTGVGRTVKVEYVRDGKHLQTDVVLGELPSDQQLAASEKGVDNVKLGLHVSPLDKSLRQKYDVPDDVTHGVVITSVDKSGVGAALDLQPGDVVIQVNKTAIKSAKQLDEAYRAAKGKLALLLYRDGATVYVVINK